MKKIKAEIIKYSKMLNSRKLSALRSGNISVRYNDGFLITPSGKKYSSLKGSDIVFVSLKGNFDKKKGIPSSEWKFHQDIYLNKKEAKAVVHAHSINATAVATHKKSIPSFHYMVAMAGGHDIKCAKYATYGTRELSKNILKALKGRKACLISNHGQIAFEKNLPKAFELAEEVENISLQYITSLKLGRPKILSIKEMKKVLSKAKNYKRG
ncbi:class II aldolase/adducin family protein [Candidatus Pelagibacter bacterium nBUS_27]|uniref:class II aldolase/adducin family protein n=1 Tax=Candidatus Pelagibacter bacterium nBUS_27 TaxID=3374188 RepID=UPI003EBB2ED8